MILALSFLFILAARAANYYRNKYFKLLLHHRSVAVMWQQSMLDVINTQVETYFKNSLATNHIVRVNSKSCIEISIGNDDFQVPVDAVLVKTDSTKAFENAYNHFLEQYERNL